MEKNKGKMRFSLWCNKCHTQHDKYKILEVNKGKSGEYYAYRDSMETEVYTYTEVILECLICKEKNRAERDEHYEMSETDMQKYGYKGANYGT